MDFKEWIGRIETVSDGVTPTPYAALSATLDRQAERPPAGTPLPALWHWLYFLPPVRVGDALTRVSTIRGNGAGIDPGTASSRFMGGRRSPHGCGTRIGPTHRRDPLGYTPERIESLRAEKAI